MTKALRTARAISAVGRSSGCFNLSNRFLSPPNLLRPLASVGHSAFLASAASRGGHFQQRNVYSHDTHSAQGNDAVTGSLEAALPFSCPGCGALTQWVDDKEAGFYTITRKPVRAYTDKRIKAAHHDFDKDSISDQEILPSGPSSWQPQTLNETPDTLPTGTYWCMTEIQ
jgi:hypothetical protein